ncbi:hypothetical protein Q456_0210820 [Escherichia coli ATCC BAA-2193]|nr:hypothetical protein Q456_0210820 [Escherichia coli ATCC BAA-2193]
MSNDKKLTLSVTKTVRTSGVAVYLMWSWQSG